MDDSKITLIVVCTIGSKRSFETTCVVSPWANKQFPWCKRLKPRLKYWCGYSLSVYTYWTWTCSHPEHEMFNINTEDLHQTWYMFSGLSLIHGPSQAKTRIWIYALPIVLRIIPKSLIRLWGCRSGTPSPYMSPVRCRAWFWLYQAKPCSASSWRYGQSLYMYNIYPCRTLKSLAYFSLSLNTFPLRATYVLLKYMPS